MTAGQKEPFSIRSALYYKGLPLKSLYSMYSSSRACSAKKIQVIQIQRTLSAELWITWCYVSLNLAVTY